MSTTGLIIGFVFGGAILVPALIFISWLFDDRYVDGTYVGAKWDELRKKWRRGA